jgi:4-hydroxybenzoate polyprenyltransferase
MDSVRILVPELAEASLSPALDAPRFPRRLYAYTRERFPLAPYALATALFFLSAYLTARGLGGRPAVFGAEGVVGLVTVFLLFLELRILDEFKDARFDAEHYPERPVPRGLVTLAELRVVGLVIVAIQLVLNALLGARILLLAVGVLLFTALTAREFFLGERLRRNFLLYTLAHMTVLPVLACYAYGLATLRGGDPAFEPAFVLYLALSYLAGLLLELTRKTRAPDAERDGVYSYTKHLGTKGLSDLAVGIAAAASLCCLGIGLALAFGVPYHAAVWLLCLVTATGLVRFRFSPTAATADRIAALYAPGYVLGVYGAIIVHVLLAA